MSNRIDTAMDALQAYLTAQLAPATLRKVERRLILPAEAHDVPVLGILPSSLLRAGGPAAASRQWELTALLMLLTRGEQKLADQTVTELIAAIDGQIDAHNAGGVAGGVWDLPRWDFWYDAGSPTIACGAIGQLRFRTDGALKT